MSRASRAKQASADTYLRYAAQDDVLRAAVKQAYANREAARNAATTQAAGVIGEVNNTLPAAKKIYRQQGAQQQLAADVYGADVAGLGGVANSIKAGAALERRNATDQLAQARSATLTGLTGQRVQARAGRQFAIQKAGSDFASDIHDILSQQKSLAAQKGAYLTSQLQALSQDAADRALDHQRLNETARHNRAGEKTAAKNADTAAGKAKRDGKDKPKLTPNERNTALDNITAARNVYQASSSEPGFHGSSLRQGLQVGGLPGADGKTIKLPKVDSNLEITAGFQLARNGYVKESVIKELKRRGYRVPKAWHKPKNSVSIGAPVGASGDISG